jgi:hypothetical protein
MRVLAHIVVPTSIILDSHASASARWLAIFLMTKPQDWEVDFDELCLTGKMSRQEIDGCILELEDVGHIAVRP